MLIGYVSDERYVALADVLLEFIDDRGESWEARSRAGGSVHADLPPGEYRVVLQKPGFGAKFSRVTVPPSRRRTSSGCCPTACSGYAWPKWVRSGEQSEFRVHSVEPYKLELWRYGWEPEFVRGLGWHDEHGPRADDADHARRRLHADRRRVEQGRLRQLRPLAVRRRPRSGAGCTTSTPDRVAAGSSRSRGSSPRRSRPPRSRCWPRTSPGTPTTTSAAAATTSTPTACRRRRPSTRRLELKRYTDAGFFTWGARRLRRRCRSTGRSRSTTSTSSEKITDPIEGRQACHLAPAEWRLLGWLEREGFAYDFYAETQLHDGTLDLSTYRVLILSSAPRILDAADVRPRQALGLRARAAG